MVTVIIPTYNRAHVLKKTIQGVLSQTYSQTFVIIIDDCSTDSTKNIVENFKKPNIIYIKNKTRLGVSKSRLVGIKNTKTQWIAFLDDDDAWHIDKLYLQIKLLKKTNSDFVLSDYYVNHYNKTRSYFVSMKNYSLDFNKHIVKAPGPFLQCCVFSTQFIIKNISSFDKQAEPSEDWAFFLSIANQNLKIEYINKTLFYWNYSQSSQSFNKKREFKALIYIVKKFTKKIYRLGGSTALSLNYRRLGFLAKNDSLDLYKHYYKQAFITQPYNIKNIYFYIKSCIN